MEFLAIIAVLFFVLFLQRKVYQKYGLHNLNYRCYFSTDRATEGDVVEIVEEVSNAKLLPLAWFKTEITTSLWLEFAGAQSVISDKSRFVPSFFMLKSYHSVTRRWHVKCLKRGSYGIDSVTLVSTDLFGGVTLSRQGEAQGRLLVLPSPLTEEVFNLTPHHLTGNVPVVRQLIPDPFEVSGVREYSGRESFRDIHWGATAKENRLMVFKKDPTSEQNLAVILNLQSRELQYEVSVDRELVELCIKIAAGVMERGFLTDVPFRLYCNTSFGRRNDCVVSSESRGVAHRENLMELLALLPNDSTEKFPIFLQNICGGIDATDIVIVTSYVDEAMVDYAIQKQFYGSKVKILSLSDTSLASEVGTEIVLLTHLRDKFITPKNEEVA